MIGLARSVAFGTAFNGLVEVFCQYDNDEDDGKYGGVEHWKKNNRREEYPPVWLCVQVVPISPSLATASIGFFSRVGDELVYAFLKGSNVLLEIVEFFDEVIEIEPDRVSLPQTHWISFLIRDGIRGEGGKFGKGNRNIGQGGDGVKGDSPTVRRFDLWCESRGCDYRAGILDLTGGFAYFVKVLCFSGV